MEICELKKVGTLKEFEEKGYRMNGGDTSAQHGYVSRKLSITRPENPVYEAGGRRKGEFFILSPRFDSSNYCTRVYLRKIF